MEDAGMIDQTRQPRKAVQPHPPEPPNQIPAPRPQTANTPDHSRKKLPKETETSLLAPRPAAQRQMRHSAAETAEASPGTNTKEPAPTDKLTKKTKGSFSKLLNTVWEETSKE
ncbi:hypothetical protein Cpir12675_005541 [Ceratocystis pirilliformis]|uniref:Uncharacterized protein n=1 Tax=Ceratocystis pirilliformis TaxID=259994 RepID=A0ABR3YQ29_9PEZI